MNILRSLKTMVTRMGSEKSAAGVPETQVFHSIAGDGLVIDGEGCLSLKAMTYQFQFGDGLAVGAAATDLGMGKSPSEDAVVVVPNASFAAVIDGVGGYWGGYQAARFFGEGFRRFPADFDKAINHAQSRLKDMRFEDSLKLYGSSACFISARVYEQGQSQMLEVGQCGDCRIILFRKNGDVIESEDESYVNDLVQKELISPDQATYHEMRNRITNSLRLAFKNEVTINPGFRVNGEPNKLTLPFEVYSGDRLCLLSDGVGDNLTPLEIRKAIADKTPAEAVAEISDITSKRMADGSSIVENLIRNYLRAHEKLESESSLTKAMTKIRDNSSQYHWLFNAIFQRARHAFGRFPDGYVSKPSRDNRALVIIDFL